MRRVFFSRGIKVTLVKQKRPTPLKWPSSNQDWLELLATIYKRQVVERERGQKAQSLEKTIAKRATEYGRAAIVHCECAKVTYLHTPCSSPAFTYIGVSELSCQPCYNWIRAFNQKNRQHIPNEVLAWQMVKGMGNTETLWQPQTVDAEFLEMMESELCERQIDLKMATRKFSLFDSYDSSESIAAPRKNPADANQVGWNVFEGAQILKVLWPCKSR